MVGIFSSRYRYSRDQVTSLAMTIGYAVAHGIPVENALNSLLPSPGASLFYAFMRHPLTSGFLYPFFKNRAHYYHGISKTIVGLHRGMYLPECLDLYLHDVLPSSYRAGVHYAFDSGKQEDLLMKLAILTTPSYDSSGTTSYMPVFAIYFGVILAITSGFFYFIAPKFERMAMEMVGTAPMPPLLSGLLHSRLLFGCLALLFWGFCLYAAIIIGYRTLIAVFRVPHRNLLRDVTMGLWYDAMYFVPFIGRHVTNKLQLDALQRTYGCLVLDQPLVDAVSFAAQSMENCRLSRRLKRFISLLYEGVDVNTALETSEAWDPFTRWLMMAGMQRQALADAMLLQIKFLADNTNRTMRFLNKATAVAFILFIGSMTAVFTIGMYETLIVLVDRLANQVM